MLANVTIQRKLILIITITVAVALSLSSAGFVVFDWLSFEKALVSRLSSTARILGSNCEAALAFNSSKDAEETLSALKAEPHVLVGAVYALDGSLFAAYRRAGGDDAPPAAAAPEGVRLEGEHLTLVSPIAHDGRALGRVYLRADREEIYDRLRQFALLIAVIFAASIGAAFWLSSRLQRLVSDPLLYLVKVARIVSSSQNYAIRAVPRKGRDELGTLVAEFNGMLDQIQKRDLALQAAHDGLEKRVEERTRALRESEERVRLHLQQTPLAAIEWDTRFRIVRWNLAAERIFGHTTDEAVGQHGNLIVPAHVRGRIAEVWADLLAGKGGGRITSANITKDGRLILCDWTNTPLTTADGTVIGVASLAEDVTQRKRTEIELKKLSVAVEQGPAVVVITDADGRIEYVNSKFTEVTGFAPEEVLGQNPRLLKSGSATPEEYRRLWETLLAGRLWTGEFLNRKKNGGTYWEHAVISPLRDADGTITHFIAIKEDITERKRTEEALHEAKEAAENATRAKSDFLARMSHELRTPLNSVIGFSNILLKNKARRLDAQEMTYLDRVRSNALHLLGLINDILDLSKVEAGRMKVELGDVALDVLLRETLALLDGQAQQKHVRLVADVPPGLAPLSTDAAKLKQILINLAGNAIKFSENGTVTVRVAADPATSVPVRIDVIDTGIGIPPERLDKLFQPFEQGDSGTSRKYGGTGLGLAICKSLGDLLGYRLEVRSEAGKGSTFSLHLAPAAVADAPSPKTTSDAPPSLAAPSLEALPSAAVPTLAGRTVLVIDDEADARFLQAQALEGTGCRILTAASGPEGLMLAAAHRPDVVLLDLLMPGMDGWEVLRRLKEDPALRAIPVVVVSVVASERRASLLGAVDRIDKPVDRDGLMAALGRALRGSPARVLVVDDDADDRRVVREHLAGAGYDVREAADGSETLAALEACAPDLVLLDLVMPGMDGTALLAEIRRSPRWSRLPVVVMTAKRLEAEESLRLAEQASTVLKKGEHTMDDIRRALESALRPGAPAPAGEPASPAPPPPGPARPAGARVLARRRLAAIIPGYLDNRRKDVKAIAEALAREDFDALRVLGHNMKGTGRGYGFDAVSDIGRDLEEAASRRDPAVIRREADKLETYLTQVEVVYD